MLTYIRTYTYITFSLVRLDNCGDGAKTPSIFAVFPLLVYYLLHHIHWKKYCTLDTNGIIALFSLFLVLLFLLIKTPEQRACRARDDALRAHKQLAQQLQQVIFLCFFVSFSLSEAATSGLPCAAAFSKK